MNKALDVLRRYSFKHLRPGEHGENERDFEFEGPGLVIICREEPPKKVGQREFAILTAVNAPNDALAVARSLLKQRSGGERYVYAMLASMKSPRERQRVL